MSLIGTYLEILKALDDNDVEYMLVGGHAVNYYGYVRATMDMDIWVDTTQENLNRLFGAFVALGYNHENSKTAVVYLREKHMIRIPKDNSMVDMFDSFIMKEDFEKSYQNHEVFNIKEITIKVIGFNDLVACKFKSNRAKDLLDVKELKTLKELREHQNEVNKFKLPDINKIKGESENKDNGISM